MCLWSLVMIIRSVLLLSDYLRLTLKANNKLMKEKAAGPSHETVFYMTPVNAQIATQHVLIMHIGTNGPVYSFRKKGQTWYARYKICRLRSSTLSP